MRVRIVLIHWFRTTATEIKLESPTIIINYCGTVIWPTMIIPKV